MSSYSFYINIDNNVCFSIFNNYELKTAAEGLYRAFIYNDCLAWVNKYLSVDLTQCDGREVLRKLFVKGCQEWLAQQK